jgi:hypothetical protein
MSRPKNVEINSINSVFIFFTELIRKIFGGDRIKRLTQTIIKLSKIISLKKKNRITILDFGCGSMEISKKLSNLSFVKKITAIDTYNSKFTSKKIQYIEYDEFFKNNKKKFDLIIVIDVLHHIGIDKSHKTLNKLKKISKNIIIKDHFEHGFFSRQLLRFVDFYANYGYGINIPKKYFNYISWEKTLNKAKLKEAKIINPFQQHDGLFNFILDKKHHFISHLKK